MATKQDKGCAPGSDMPHRLGAHPEQGKIGAHEEAKRLGAYDPAESEVVPAVTADVDETPKAVRYGAAILLGLAFGIGCYLWFGDVPSAPQRPEGPFAGRQYARTTAASGQMIPSPFTAEGYVVSPELVVPVEIIPDVDGEMLADAGGSMQSEGATAGGQPVVYLFAYDSSSIPENAVLTALARAAREKGLSLDVKAYTDSRGRLAYNKRLSAQRAKAVADYLKAHGVPVAKISAVGMGPTKAYANDAQDRRAEIYTRR